MATRHRTPLNPIEQCRSKLGSAWLHFPQFELLFLFYAFEGAVASQVAVIRQADCPEVFFTAIVALVSDECGMDVRITQTLIRSLSCPASSLSLKSCLFPRHVMPFLRLVSLLPPFPPCLCPAPLPSADACASVAHNLCTRSPQRAGHLQSSTLRRNRRRRSRNAGSVQNVLGRGPQPVLVGRQGPVGNGANYGQGRADGGRRIPDRFRAGVRGLYQERRVVCAVLPCPGVAVGHKSRLGRDAEGRTGGSGPHGSTQVIPHGVHTLRTVSAAKNPCRLTILGVTSLKLRLGLEYFACFGPVIITSIPLSIISLFSCLIVNLVGGGRVCGCPRGRQLSSALLVLRH